MMRQEIYALSDGDFVICFPDNLSYDSVKDLEAYLNVFLNRKRRMSHGVVKGSS